MNGVYHEPAAAPQWPRRRTKAALFLPLAMRPKAAARALGISERTLWTLTQRCEIPHARIGACVLYPSGPVIAWLEKLTGHPPVKRPEAAEGGDA